MQCSVTLALLMLLGVCTGREAADNLTPSPPPPNKEKRQIFREQVLPHTGGKIPEEAFRADRLALNRLNKDGITVPDGILLDARHVQKQHHHPNMEVEMALIKVIISPDGRYVAPAGRYHLPHPETVTSTYLIRPPIGSYEKRWHRQGPNSPRAKPVNKPRPFAVQQQQSQDNNHQTYPHINGLAEFRETHNAIFPDYYHPFYVPQWTGFDPAIANIATTWGESTHRDFKTPDSLELIERFARRIQTSKVGAQDNQIANAPAQLPDKKENDEIKTSASAPKTTEVFHCDQSKSQRIQGDPKDNCQGFYVCQPDGRHDSFRCPKGTLFNKAISQCDWWYNVKCG